MGHIPTDDLKFATRLAAAIRVLKSRAGWDKADLDAHVEARIRCARITTLSLDEDREAAILEVLDAIAEPYLELIDDEIAHDAFLCLLENFRRRTPVRLAGPTYANPESAEAERLAQKIDVRVHYWREEAEMRLAQNLLLTTPAERRARRCGVLGTFAHLRDRVSELAAAADTTKRNPEWRSASATVDKRQDRRALVDAFIRQCRVAGFDIIRKHIWMAAGHTSSRQFEYWQRQDENKATRASDRKIRQILSMKPEELVKRLEELLEPEKFSEIVRKANWTLA